MGSDGELLTYFLLFFTPKGYSNLCLLILFFLTAFLLSLERFLGLFSFLLLLVSYLLQLALYSPLLLLCLYLLPLTGSLFLL
jgi:hypothetical protein